MWILKALVDFLKHPVGRQHHFDIFQVARLFHRAYYYSIHISIRNLQIFVKIIAVNQWLIFQIWMLVLPLGRSKPTIQIRKIHTHPFFYKKHLQGPHSPRRVPLQVFPGHFWSISRFFKVFIIAWFGEKCHFPVFPGWIS